MGGDTVSSPSSSDVDINWGGFSDAESSSDDGYRSFEADINERRKKASYEQVATSYDELKDRAVNLELAKTKILSYTPGLWVENVGGMTVNDYNVPKTTTLLLIGPKGSGKSSLVNRISRVFEDDKFAPERAQVTYNSSEGDGTCFLREYMIPRDSTSFCLFDTRSFSNDLSENLQMIRRWITKGVRHGKLVKSASDNSNFQARMKHKCGRDKLLSYESRTVNFVIFVVNGLSVLKCMNSDGSDTLYTQMVANTFSSQFLSFKDHKPAIAITHGDLLSISERARVRVYLGELLGVHPCKQTFDIPDDRGPTTELAIVDMVRYALEHADRNLPCKTRPKISKARKIYGSNLQLWTCLLLLLAAGMFIFTAHHQGFCSLKAHPEKVPEPRPDIEKSVKIQPDVVLESSLVTQKVMEVHHESVSNPTLEIKKSMEAQPEIVLEPSPEVKKDMEVHQESVLKKIKRSMEFQPEIVLEPISEIKEALEVHQETNLKPTPNIKKSVKVQPEIVLEPSWEIKEVMEVQESILKRSPKIKEVHRESVQEPILEKKKPSLEMQKVMKVQPKNVPEPSLEKKKESAEKVVKVQPEIVLEPRWEIKEVMEVQESILNRSPKIKEVHRESVREPILEKKKPSLEKLKVMKVQPKNVPEPSLEKKKENEERVHKRGQKFKRGHAGRVDEPAMEIDWKKIRHLWYK